MAEGAHFLYSWKVVGGLNVLNVEAILKPPISSRKMEKLLQPGGIRIGSKESRQEPVYQGKRTSMFSRKKNIVKCVQVTLCECVCDHHSFVQG